MTKVLRTKPADFIAAMADRAEHKSFIKLRDDFERVFTHRFFSVVKDVIEDWSDAITNEELLTNRLKTLAAKETYSENNKIDMALICAILWNIEEVGE